MILNNSLNTYYIDIKLIIKINFNIKLANSDSLQIYLGRMQN